MRSASPLLVGVLAFCLGFVPVSTEIDPPEPRVSSLTGTWDVTMTGDNTQLTGTMTVQPDGSGQVVFPEQHINAEVRDGELMVDGALTTWQGSLRTPLGGVSFTLRGMVRGDSFVGRNEVRRVGSFEVRARRSSRNQ